MSQYVILVDGRTMVLTPPSGLENLFARLMEYAEKERLLVPVPGTEDTISNTAFFTLGVSDECAIPHGVDIPPPVADLCESADVFFPEDDEEVPVRDADDDSDLISFEEDDPLFDMHDNEPSYDDGYEPYGDPYLLYGDDDSELPDDDISELDGEEHPCNGVCTMCDGCSV